MMWFLSKILGLVPWLISLLIAVFRGRTFTLPPEEKKTERHAFSHETIRCDPWLDRVERLTLRVKQGSYELIVALPYVLASHHLRNLGAVLFLCNGIGGVEYRAAVEGIRIYGHRLHIVPLGPVSTVSILVKKRGVGQGGSSSANVERIELNLDGRRKNFFYDETRGFFYPTAKNQAIGF